MDLEFEHLEENINYLVNNNNVPREPKIKPHQKLHSQSKISGTRKYVSVLLAIEVSCIKKYLQN